MKYSDLDVNVGFYRNMRETNWLKLFPHWWSENDPLLETVGQEVEFLKAQGIFTLLNATLKPPVMLWQTSIDHKEYVVEESIQVKVDEEDVNNVIEIDAPLYKTWGTIAITNQSNENIHNLKVSFTDDDWVIIKNVIKPQNQALIDLNNQKVYIDKKEASIETDGTGISYFKTDRLNSQYQANTPLHNEVLRISFSSDTIYDNPNIDVKVVLNNVVFINEQNIEVTGLELIPIKSIEIYSYFDFPYHTEINGWQKTQEKVYQEDTNVVYDMITVQNFTKKFYVDVWYKGLDYPYRVGFPAYKDAESDSIYHINDNLDVWGEYFGMPRRIYRENIPEEDYPYTFPIFYPFDIEQDFWYYSRLVNEYSYNELAINDIDLVDTDDTPIVRLHSINPFVEDFVVHAKTIYPTDDENIIIQKYIPNYVTQYTDNEFAVKRTSFFDLENLLKYDDNYAIVTLRNKIGKNITYQKYLSKELKVFFDLKDLPSDSHIENLQIIVDAESTDNKKNKYSSEVGLIIPGISDSHIFPLQQSDVYQLERNNIIYTLSDTIDDIKSMITTVDSNVIQTIHIDSFEGEQNTYITIPFVVKENDDVQEITDVYVTYDGIGTYVGQYDNNEIKVFLPNGELTTMSISCICKDGYPCTIKDIEILTNDNTAYVDAQNLTEEWHTNDLRNIIQKGGIYFVNTYQNDDETNMPSFLIHNITLEATCSPKKSDFILNTQIIKKEDQNIVGQLKVEVINVGDKNLQTVIDIVAANNLRLSNNFIDIDLSIGESYVTYIDIKAEYPIKDGTYDILTVCEDQHKVNNIILSSNGLIKTNITIQPHYITYGNDIILYAELNTIDDKMVDNNIAYMSFYIDDYFVGRKLINNNIGQIIINQNNAEYKYFTPGLHKLEARFEGTTQYASSRSRTYLSVLRTDIELDISEMPNDAIKDKEYTGIVSVYSVHNNVKTPLILQDDEYNVMSFYIDDYFIGQGTVGDDGKVHFVSAEPIDVKTGEHILRVDYEGTNTYVQQRAEKNINVIGGNVKVNVFDAEAKPTEKVKIQAKVINDNNQPINGEIVFKIYDNNDNIVYESESIALYNGIATMEYVAPILPTSADQTGVEYKVQAFYHDTNEAYLDGLGEGKITIARHNIIIESTNIFYASQYEPLGFYLHISDAVTGEPVTEGTVTIQIPSQGIECSGTVDQDGGVRIIHNIVNFTAQDFQRLLHFAFKTGNLMPPENMDIVGDTDYNDNDLYRIYDGDLSDLNIMDFQIIDGQLFYNHNATDITDVSYDEEGNIIIENLPPGYEQLYIDKDGYLYARTNIDSLRQYITGLFDININYSSEYLYHDQSKKSQIFLEKQDTNVDLQKYDMMYNEEGVSITCYLSNYNLYNDAAENNIEGNVQFLIDGVRVGISAINENMAILNPVTLKSIDKGNHLLEAVYTSTNGRQNTYTYSTLMLRAIPSTVIAELLSKTPGKRNQLNVTVALSNIYSIPIEGTVEVFLNDKKIASDYLYGIESTAGNVALDSPLEYQNMNTASLSFFIDLPEDISERDTLCVKYLGNNYIDSSSHCINLNPELTEITSIKTKDILYLGKNEMCSFDVELITKDNSFVNDGIITLSSNKVLAQAYVKNNKATLSWYNEDLDISTLYLSFNGSKYYQPISKEQSVVMMDLVDDVYIKQSYEDVENNSDEEQIQDWYPLFDNIDEALQCVKENGNVHILDTLTLDKDLVFNKSINIIGYNNSQIIKDVTNLLSDSSNIKIYDFSYFEDEIYEIIGLTLDYLDNRHFTIVDNDLYLIENEKLILIYLLNDGKFYAKRNILLTSLIPQINISVEKNVKVSIDNIEFTTNDTDTNKDLLIVNRGILSITKTILHDNITIRNYGDAYINRNLLYCFINNYGTIDLNNNWWGSNTVDNDSITNNIILKIDSSIDPPVLSEDITIRAYLIGTNGMHYDLPPVDFIFSADTGYFSIDCGKTITNNMYTTYIDGTKEGKVYCTVDNETVSLDILHYDRKTEVILETMDIPIGYQTELTAKVHSCADYYQDNKIVDNGYVIFYLENDGLQQIGRANVQSGTATLPVYFSSSKYSIHNPLEVEQYNYKVIATYIPNEYYFTSTGENTINLINANNVCYVSPTYGSNENDGSFEYPKKSIQGAIIENKERIYLKQGTYKDYNIDVLHNSYIKKYDADIIFEDNDHPIFISNNNSTLTLVGLVFQNNTNNIIKNIDNIVIRNCIFYNNMGKPIIENKEMVDIQYSVFVNNEKILSDYRRRNNILFCWFGTNNPLDDGHVFDRYVVMTVKASKDPLYIGTVAQITASLKHYKHDGNIYPLNKELPLRMAYFKSNIGSLMPIKDYTYNNKASSLFNINEEDHTQDAIISIPNNTNYFNKASVYQCYVTDLYGNPKEDANIRFSVIDSNNKVKVESYMTHQEDGLYQYNDVTPLKMGTYILTCIDVNTEFKTSRTFDVIMPYIKVDEITINNTDHLYSLIFDLFCTDVFDNTITQMIDIYIDDKFIDTGLIQNGILHKELSYSLLSQGQHTLKLSSEKYSSEYSVFNYSIKFNSTKKQTNIVFVNHNDNLPTRIERLTLPPSEATTLSIQVTDDNNNNVHYGSIDIWFDNQLYIQELQLQNGFADIDNFICDEIGQHTLTVHYSGEQRYYEEKSINANIYVGVEEVQIMTPDTIIGNLNSPLNLSIPIYDQSMRTIKRGIISVIIDGITIKNDLEVKNGYAYFNDALPTNIQAGNEHDITIQYVDPLNKYAKTSKTSHLHVSEIPTQILVNPIYANPGIPMIIDYDIDSTQGTVHSGELIVTYNDAVIGTSSVADIQTKVKINTPFFDNGDTFTFKYIGTNNYASSSIDVVVMTEKTDVNITTSYTRYYPKTDFDFIVNCKDIIDNDITLGNVTLYIDNVKFDTQEVFNGECSFKLIFNDVKEYHLMLVYDENKYYNRTIKEQSFYVNNIPIDDILIDNLESNPNETIEVQLSFISNFDVNDGFVDFYFDDNKIHTYAIIQGDKYAKIKIPNTSAGEHTLTIQYYNSLIFADYVKNYTFTIKEQNVDIHLSDITTTFNEEVSFYSTFSTPITGVLEYYLIFGNDEKFIGLQQVNNAIEAIYPYLLPNTLDQSQYGIKVQYKGNDQYGATYDEATLFINKQNVQITNIVCNDVEYQKELNVSFETDIMEKHNFDIGIKKNDVINKIGTTQSNDGVANFNIASLDSSYTVGEYTLCIMSSETVIFYEQMQQKDFIITPTTPHLQNTNLECYIGNVIQLPNIVLDNDDNRIDGGSFTYSKDNIIIDTDEENKIKIEDTSDVVIHVKYHSDNENFNNLEDDVHITMLKNNIIFSISNYGPVYRGETIIEDITVSSTTTDLTPNIEYTVLLDDIEVNVPEMQVPLSLEDKQSFVLTCNFEGNDIFKPTHQTFNIVNKNLNIIKLSTNNLNDGETVDDLQLALDLVKNYGTIQVEDDIANMQARNIKHINIDGNNHIFDNCNIVNDGELTIKDIEFKNSADSVIKTNNKCYIYDCTFANNNAQYGAAIYIDSKNNDTLISHCTFNQNVASLYGGAIFSNKGNDITIQYSTFSSQNEGKSHGSSIAINGNMYLLQNMFFNNKGESEIYLMQGTLEAEKNYFDGSIKTIHNYMGNVIANLNYWGYNDIQNIEQTYLGTINIDNWLISDYTMEKYEPELGHIVTRIIGHINKYKNRLEKENVQYQDVIGDVPIFINNEQYYLNQINEIDAQDINIQIGQETNFEDKE